MVEVGGNQYMLEILDTAGTEHFTAMREMYIKNGHGFVLIYSITAESSFHEVKDIRNQIVEIKSDKVPMVIAGNKCDLENLRVISTEQGKQLAQSFKCPFMETSAKLNINVENLFIELTKLITQSQGKSSSSSSSSGKKRGCVLL